MPSRSLVILSALVSFGLGCWGGRQLTHQQALESDAVAPRKSSPAPEVRDSAATLRARIEATSTAGLVALYEELADRRWPDPDSLLAYRTLIERCLREDPEGLDTPFNLFMKEHRARELVQVWLEVDAEGFFDRFFNETGPAGESMRREAAFAAPQQFLEAALLRKDRVPESDTEIGSALVKLSDTDPRAAIAWIDRFALREDTKASASINGTTGAHVVNSVHAEVAARYAAIDPEGALAWAQARTTPAGKKSVTIAAITGWILTDPEAAALAFSGLSDSLSIQPLDIGRRIAATDPALAFSWMEKQPTSENDYSWVDSLSRFVRDPGMLRQIGSQITDPRARHRLLSENLSNWGSRPFDTGLDWALSAPAGSQDSALRALARGVANVDYDDAVKLTAQIGDEALREVFLRGLKSNLYDKDPIRLFEIVRASGDENELASTIEWAAYTHAMRPDYPPEEVFEWTREAGGGLRGDLYEELAQRYYREDPVKAQAWIDSLDNGYEKSFLLRGLALEMSQRAPEKALEWASNYPQTELREEVVSSVAWHLAEKRPEKAFDLALNHSYASRESLMNTLTRSVRSWARQDPAAVRAAIAGAQALTERERHSLSTWIYAP